MSLYLGLMSGTSVDGIDAAIIQCSETVPLQVLHTRSFEYPDAWRSFVLALGQGQQNVDLDELGRCDVALGAEFARCALTLIKEAQLKPSDIRAIGSHGQTIRHRPRGPHPFTLQIGCPHVIAERTGICTVADFRRRDVAAGGQGAPLVPAFHAAAFASAKPVAVLNLGGIANVTLINGANVQGFDTGPANAILDAHIQTLGCQTSDIDGALAASGQIDQISLAKLLSDAYFTKAAPKSTGREHFNLAWAYHIAPELAANSAADRQATLTELSARSAATALREFGAPDNYVCGGGVHNHRLMQRISAQLAPNQRLQSTAVRGLHPDFVEATAFAWLAQQTLEHKPGNLNQVTGAKGLRVLGAICLA
jgi:anhydro-N-acetylmuramic acid kinase